MFIHSTIVELLLVIVALRPPSCLPCKALRVYSKKVVPIPSFLNGRRKRYAGGGDSGDGDGQSFLYLFFVALCCLNCQQ